MSNIYAKTLDQIIFLYQGYSQEHRATTQPFHLAKLQKFLPNYQYNCQDLVVREPLIEHTGSLPIVATTIYPQIKEPTVDLGQALIMLAIHDIGEIVVGDEMTFIKNQDKNSEREAALKLLPKEYRDLYLVMEDRTTNTGKFAKAIDKITPDIVDLITPVDITLKRYQAMMNISKSEIVPMIKQFKHPYMTWNKFLTGLHLEILERMKKKLT